MPSWYRVGCARAIVITSPWGPVGFTCLEGVEINTKSNTKHTIGRIRSKRTHTHSHSRFRCRGGANRGFLRANRRRWSRPKSRGMGMSTELEGPSASGHTTTPHMHRPMVVLETPRRARRRADADLPGISTRIRIGRRAGSAQKGVHA